MPPPSEAPARPTVALAFATALGLGYAPIAPGTVGSAAGVLLWLVLPFHPLVHVGAVLVLFVVGAWSASAAELHFGRTDPGAVVIDEVMGMLIALALIPVGWKAAALAFLLFRAFDIWKPFPVRRFERLPGGWGIMADDAMAGVYANGALHLVMAITHLTNYPFTR